MKKVFLLMAGIFLLVSCAEKKQVLKEEFVPQAQEESSASSQGESTYKGYTVKFPFYVYKDRVSRGNHYIPSGWMGDYGDLKINENYKTNPYSGKTCIRIAYTARKSQGAGWAGIYWQNPANNWGTVKGGYDLRGAKELVFYARGEKGGEVAEFKMGGIQGEYSDTDMATTGPVTLSKRWKKYAIDLKDLDLSYISGGFCWVASSQDNPDGCTIYLDEVVYIK